MKSIRYEMLRHKSDNNVQVLYTENYILMMKEGKKDVNRDIPCPWGRRLTIVISSQNYPEIP